jgi:hypothetical protein
MIKRIVSTGFWTDDKVLDMTPDEKLFMLYLITNPHSTQLGIYKSMRNKWHLKLDFNRKSYRIAKQV